MHRGAWDPPGAARALEFRLGAAQFGIVEANELHTPVLRQVSCEPDGRCALDAHVRRALALGRLFPPLVATSPGPEYALPTDTAVLLASDSAPELRWVAAERTIDPDLFRRALRQLIEDLARHTRSHGLWLADAPACRTTLLSRRSLWCAPGPLLLSADELQVAMVSGQLSVVPSTDQAAWNAYAATGIAECATRALTLSSEPSQQLAALADALGAHSPSAPSFAALIELIESGATLADGPEVARAHSPSCPGCKVPWSYGEACSRCGKSPSRSKGYRHLLPPWCVHDDLGLKPIVRFRHRAAAPPKEVLNAALSQAGVADERVLEVIRARSKTAAPEDWRSLVLVLTSADGDVPLARRAIMAQVAPGAPRRKPKPRRKPARRAQPAKEPKLFAPRRFPLEGGARFVWTHGCPTGTEFHFWWSPEPLDKDWDAIPKTAHHVVTGAENECAVQVETAVSAFVAVGAVCGGRRLGPMLAGPFELTPVQAPPTVAASVVPEQDESRRKSSPPEAPPSAPPLEAGEEIVVGEASVRVLEILEARGEARRALASSGGAEFELLDLVASSPLATALASGDDVPNSVPPVLAQASGDGRTRLLLAPRDPGRSSLPEWCRGWREGAGDYAAVNALLSSLLESLHAWHGLGLAFGALDPEHIQVDSSGAARLACPLAPLTLGSDASDAKGILGTICPEFGFHGKPVHPSWDLFSLGALVLWGLAGSAPPTWVSRSRSLPNLRTFLPNLPVGWAAWFERLLARPPEDRFASAQAAAERLPSLLPTPSAAPGAMTLAAALHTGKAKALRNPHNQDRCFMAPIELLKSYASQEEYVTGDLVEAGTLVFGISDGVSTSHAGEFASSTLAASTGPVVAQIDPSTPPTQFLEKLLDGMNVSLGQAIHERAMSAPDSHLSLHPTQAPSATLAAVRIGPGSAAAVGSVGDSRVYLLRDGTLDLLTVDGDQLTVYLRKGLEPQDAAGQEDSLQLVSWAGRFEVEGSGETRRIQPLRPRALSADRAYSTLALDLRAGDVLCCCSDGLSDYVDAGQIDLASVLGENGPHAACRLLLDAANACGGHDNISVIVARVHPLTTVDYRSPSTLDSNDGES